MTGLFVLAVVVAGLMVGSFLNVCISRLPRGESVVFPRSRCPSCGAAIRWSDNVPVVSYLALRGRCRSCDARIAVRYLLVEIGTAAAFAVQAFVVGADGWLLASRLVLTALLIVLFVTDLETHRLPNAVTLSGLVAGLAFSVRVSPGLASSLFGAALGAAIPLAIRGVWRMARGVEGMGLGDVKMLAMIGAFLGWVQVWLVLFLASLSGALVGIALVVAGVQTMRSRLPFGTFLAAAAFLASLFGDRLVGMYAGLFG
jgi:leader peptidase (prepilin peptidase) / N-methyltransferase